MNNGFNVIDLDKLGKNCYITNCVRLIDSDDKTLIVDNISECHTYMQYIHGDNIWCVRMYFLDDNLERYSVEFKFSNVMKYAKCVKELEKVELL